MQIAKKPGLCDSYCTRLNMIDLPCLTFAVYSLSAAKY